jgi:hypothetical protein
VLELLILFDVLAKGQPLDKLHDHEDSLSSLVHKGLHHPDYPWMLQGLDQLVLLESHILVLVVHAPNYFDSVFLILNPVLRRLVLLCYQVIFLIYYYWGTSFFDLYTF